jgi:hypothetical protein
VLKQGQYGAGVVEFEAEAVFVIELQNEGRGGSFAHMFDDLDRELGDGELGLVGEVQDSLDLELVADKAAWADFGATGCADRLRTWHPGGLPENWRGTDASAASTLAGGGRR